MAERRRRQRRKAPAISENLLGSMCCHQWVRYRGYRMCSRPFCAALSNIDGTRLTKTEWTALIKQLRSEGIFDW